LGLDTDIRVARELQQRHGDAIGVWRVLHEFQATLDLGDRDLGRPSATGEQSL